jgi:maltokinase
MTSHDHLVTSLVAELPGWLPTQRWFAGKDRAVTAVRPLGWTVLAEGDPLLLHLVVAVEQDGRSEPYQLLVGARRSLPSDVSESSLIGAPGGLTAYEASGDAELTAALLDLVADGGAIGSLSFVPEPGADLTRGLRGRPISTEQSNTSLVYGSQYILKLFRKLSPGINKDLQLHRALREVGCQQIAEVLGSISLGSISWGSITDGVKGEPATVGMLQRFVPDATDGWVMATSSVRQVTTSPDEVGGDFAPEAERLGRAVATVHADLARALGSQKPDQSDLDQSVDAMLARLTRVSDAVPELAPHVPAVEHAFRSLRDAGGAPSVQHVHGDLHLGQVLRAPQGWLLLDFEGEPAATVAERSALRSPLRDVAGMLRSFDYAAQQLLVGHDDPQLVEPVTTWARRNRSAFCDGYAAVAGADPRDQAEVLLAFELDKAVYEVSYEHANRPAWLSVPLASIERITTEGS